MAKKALDPSKLISDSLISLAQKNKAKSYAAWVNDNVPDTRLKSYSDLTGASTEYALARRDLKGNEAAANSGYGKYLSDMQASRYFGAVNKTKNEIETAKQRSITDYQKYVEGIDNKRKELVNSTFKSLITSGVMDFTLAYKKALAAGLSESDAKAVARDTTSVTRTETFKSAVSTIVSKFYTYRQATEYARRLGLPESDVEELGSLANVLNQITSTHKNYTSDYTAYIDGLLNTQK